MDTNQTSNDKLSVKDKIEMCYKNHNNIQELIRFMDTKGYTLLVVYGFVITVFLSFIKGANIICKNSTICNYICFAFLLIFILAMIYESYIILIKIFKPRLSGKAKRDKLSNYYFEHIASMEIEDFIKNINDLDKNKLLKDLSIQIHEISIILKKKTKNISLATNVMLFCIISLFIFICFLEITKSGAAV